MSGNDLINKKKLDENEIENIIENTRFFNLMHASTAGDRLYLKANTGNKHWFAKLTALDNRFGFDREFICYQPPRTSKRSDGHTEIFVGDIIERVRYTHSGKNNSRHYCLITHDGEVREIEKPEVIKLLENK